MPAREIVYDTGEYKRVYYAPMRRAARGRCGKKLGMTSEVQARYNAKRAEALAADILNLNFTPADLAFHLTFRSENMPDTFDEGKHEVDKLMRRIKYRWSKVTGRPGREYKYFVVPEPTSTGRLHFHCVISGGLDRDVVERLWPHGYANADRLRFDYNGLEGLTHYILKTPGYAKKRWYCSQNLVRPEPRQNDYRVRVGDVNALAEGALGGTIPFELMEKLYPGWTLIPDSIEVAAPFCGTTSTGEKIDIGGRKGCPFVTFRLYRTDSPWFKWMEKQKWRSILS